MTLSNWVELGVMALIIVVGTFLWRHFKRKLQEKDGFEGVFTEKNTAPPRAKMNVEDERSVLTEKLKKR